MEDLVEKLLNSGNKVLEAAGKELPKWKRLKHNKRDLELFLRFNIAHIKYKPKTSAVLKDIVCTSSTRFIEVFSMLKESDKMHAVKHAKDSGIHTEDKSSVLTFNLLENRYETMVLDTWEIVSFLTITQDNIEILDSAVNDLLKRPVEHDIPKQK